MPAAVLAWIVVGSKRWYANEQVAARRPASPWRGDDELAVASDVGFLFASEHLVAAKDHFITAERMFAEFSTFLAGQGKRAWSKQLVNNRLPDSLRAAGILVDDSRTTVHAGPPGRHRVQAADAVDRASRPEPPDSRSRSRSARPCACGGACGSATSPRSVSRQSGDVTVDQTNGVDGTRRVTCETPEQTEPRARRRDSPNTHEGTRASPRACARTCVRGVMRNARAFPCSVRACIRAAYATDFPPSVA